MSTRVSAQHRLRVTGLVAGITLVLTLAACSGGKAGLASTLTSQSSSSASPTQPSQRPGTSGTIAAVSGDQLQVQNPNEGQVTVYVTSSTDITKIVDGERADLTSGACVLVTGPDQTTNPADGPDTTPFSAVSVRILSTSGTCRGQGGGFGGSPGARPSFSPPAGVAPGAIPSDAQFPRTANGKVSSVSGSTMVVQASGASGSTSNITITLTSDTTYTKTIEATESALVVGQCATAFGEADDTGAITATTVSVSPPDADGCTTGFGRGGFGGPGGFGQPQGGGSNG